MILEKRAARLIKHPWSLRLGGGVETPLMPGVRSKRCRQARPLTGWVDSQSESDRGSVTLINAETPVALGAERSTRPGQGRHRPRDWLNEMQGWHLFALLAFSCIAD